ncbi:hypothetical protein F6X56_15085 [Rhodococcus erythropolis]|uniref:hypothetical protein n=1 Tax=Rhodococcus erythropolis TaxID=1833 RepID=UPI0012455799|nr:hypothetical protein [Rhodococcus erythropolis]QEX10946.1 hypothetical protein F6X56_15085 [Rhodococcus erythropolis]
MRKTYHVPIAVKLMGVVSVEAEDQEEAYKKAEDTMFWANQRGAPEQHKAVSITDCEIEVDGEELDLFKERDEPEDA